MKESGTDEGHTISFENEHIKVFETFLKESQKLTMHAHKPHLRYCVTAGVNIHTWENGDVETVVDKPGDYEWRDTLVHAVENGGDCVIHSLIFELKKDFVPPTKQEQQQSVKNSTAFLQTADLKKIYDVCQLIADNDRVRIYELNVKPSNDVYWRPDTLVFGQMEQDQKVTIQSALNDNEKIILKHKEPQWIKSGYYKISANRPTTILLIELLQTDVRSSN